MPSFSEISTLLLIFPAYYAYENDLYFPSVAIMLSMFGSLLYHNDENCPWGFFVDLAGCIFITAAGFYMLLNTKIVFTYLNLFASVCFLIAFVSYVDASTDMEKYHFFHSVWHLMLVYAISSFLYSYVQHHVVTDTGGRTIVARPLLSGRWSFFSPPSPVIGYGRDKVGDESLVVKAAVTGKANRGGVADARGWQTIKRSEKTGLIGKILQAVNEHRWPLQKKMGHGQSTILRRRGQDRRLVLLSATST